MQDMVSMKRRFIVTEQANPERQREFTTIERGRLHRTAEEAINALSAPPDDEPSNGR